MCLIDALIVGLLALKAGVLLVVCSFKRSIATFVKYSWGAEIFVVMLCSFSLPLYFVSDYYGRRLDLMENNASAQDLANNRTSLDRALNAALFQLVLIGILLVHFSPEYAPALTWTNTPGSRQTNMSSSNSNEYRKAVLERKGFVQNAKPTYVLRPVDTRITQFSKHFGMTLMMSAKAAVPSGFNRPEIAESFGREDQEDLDTLLHNRKLAPQQETPEIKRLQEEIAGIKNKALSIQERCASCGVRRRDMIIVPCGHSDICLVCFNSSLHKPQKCPTCEHEAQLAVVFEPILGSKNLKVLAEFSRATFSN